MTGTRKLKKLIFTFSISLNTSHAIQSQAHSRQRHIKPKDKSTLKHALISVSFVDDLSVLYI